MGQQLSMSARYERRDVLGSISASKPFSKSQMSLAKYASSAILHFPERTGTLRSRALCKKVKTRSVVGFPWVGERRGGRLTRVTGGELKLSDRLVLELRV